MASTRAKATSVATATPPIARSGKCAASGTASFDTSAMAWPSTTSTTISGSRNTTPPINVVFRALNFCGMADLRAGVAGVAQLSGWADNRHMDDKTMLLVDGSSYLYRAYHALPDLRAPDGFPTGAIRGFVAMLKLLREQYPAAHAACVFDAKGPTFRDDWYAEYKAQRAPMPEPLAQQIAPIHEAVRLLGWPVLEVPGIEADDAIGTMARVAAEAGHQVIVSTGDKDLAQLVNARVTLINTMSNEKLDEAAVLAKFGVPPQRIVDYLDADGRHAWTTCPAWTRSGRRRRRSGSPNTARSTA